MRISDPGERQSSVLGAVPILKDEILWTSPPQIGAVLVVSATDLSIIEMKFDNFVV